MTTALRAADTKRERLSIQTIRRTLDPEAVGKHLYLFDEVESTNAVLRDLARSGAAVGTVVLAESQRQGRGRLGRPWFSPPDVNLYAAVLLGPRLRLKEAGPLSFIGSLAVSDAIRELGLSPGIKWPNDVLLGREKVSGALLEWVPFSADTGSAVIGVGVNLNVDVELLRRALGPDGGRATSVAGVLGRPVDRSRFAASFLGHLDRWWRRYCCDGIRPILAAWQDRDILTGRRVELRGPASSVEGRVLGIDPDGHLIVRSTLGDLHVVLSEDIRVLD